MRTIKTLAVAVMSMAVSSIAVAQEIGGVELQKKADVFAGVGFGNFAQQMGDVTGTGIGWALRVGVQPLRYAGAEIAYQGINAGVDTIIQGQGVFTDQNINQQQVTLNAKVGWPFMVADRELRPYGLLGIGYSHIGVDSGLSAVGFANDSNLSVPLGVGVQYSVNEIFQVDARYNYNFLSGVNQPIVNDSANSWSALINVGAQFGQ